MTRYVRNGAEVWVGVLPKLGVVVYDPQSQVDVPAGRVRLYVCDQKRMAVFVKSVVRDRMAQSSHTEPVDERCEPAALYLSLRRRYTHCFSCKRSLNSLDFEVCRQCRWIRCGCGACRCSFHG